MTEKIKFAEALRKQVNYVEGFEPEKHLECVASTNSGKVKYYLPVNIKRAWFRAVYPQGKIDTSITEIIDNVIYAKCDLYFAHQDEKPFHTEEASVVVYPVATNEKGSIKEECLCDFKAKVKGAATSKALSNAGFGAQVEYLIEDFEAEFIDKSVLTPKPVEKVDTPNYDPAADLNKKLDEKKKKSSNSVKKAELPVEGKEAPGTKLEANSPLVTEIVQDSTTLAPTPKASNQSLPTITSEDDIVSEVIETDASVNAPKTQISQDADPESEPESEPDTQVNLLAEARNYIVPDEMASAKGKRLEDVFNLDPQFIAYLASKSKFEETRKYALILVETSEEAKALYSKYANGK